MRAVIQRVARASVSFEDGVRREIGKGLLVLLGVGPEDAPEEAGRLAEKIAVLRVFPDDSGKFDRSLLDVGGSALVVSQFTLFGDCRNGRRPDFTGAAKPELAEPLYERFVAALKGLGVPTETGRFGAAMQVELVNDGPVTLALGFGA